MAVEEPLQSDEILSFLLQVWRLPPQSRAVIQFPFHHPTLQKVFAPSILGVLRQYYCARAAQILKSSIAFWQVGSWTLTEYSEAVVCLAIPPF